MDDPATHLNLWHSIDSLYDSAWHWSSHLQLAFQIALCAGLCWYLTCCFFMCWHCCCYNTCVSDDAEGVKRPKQKKRIIHIKEADGAHKRRLSGEGKKSKQFKGDIQEDASSSDYDSVGSSTMNEGGSVLSALLESIRTTLPGKKKKKRRKQQYYGKLHSYDLFGSRDNIEEYVEQVEESESESESTEEKEHTAETAESCVISVISSSHVAFRFKH